MIEFLFFLLGLVIVIFTAIDFFYTTLSINGAGPLTKVATHNTSALFLFLNRRTPSRLLLSYSGVFHILVLTCLWIGLLWLGLFLILSGSETSIVHTFTKESPQWVNRLYFSGYILSTLGNGEFVPSNGGWQIVAVLFSFSGFIFITIIISYLVNLTSTVIKKRALSLFIANIGQSAEDIIINTYSNGSFSNLIALVSNLQEKINHINQSHYAYPLSHYFTSISIENSLPVNLFNLNEALYIIKYRVAGGDSLEQELRPLNNAIQNFLKTIKGNFIKEVQFDKELKLDRERLIRHNISLVSESNLSDQNFSTHQERRYLLYGYLKSSGWNLEDIHLDDINTE